MEAWGGIVHGVSEAEVIAASVALFASLVWRVGASACPVAYLSAFGTLGAGNKGIFGPHSWASGVDGKVGIALARG